MNRGTRTLVVLLVALVAAGAASYGVYRAIQLAPVRQVQIPGQPTVVAARTLPVGTLVAKGDLKIVEWPAASPVQGGFANIDEVVGRGLLAGVAANEPITEPKLAVREAGAGLPPTITSGMRAISVRVNEVIGVAGFVVPGTHVDVLVTVNRQENSVARAVVSNVLVLAAGTRYDQEQSRDGKPVPSTVVTLVVTPEDAERIALASNEGRITLTLRNPLDLLPTETKGVTLASLTGPPAPPPVETTVKGRRIVVPPPPPPPPPKVYTVETIRAAKRTEEVIR